MNDETPKNILRVVLYGLFILLGMAASVFVVKLIIQLTISMGGLFSCL